jgi:hypothetical protein
MASWSEADIMQPEVIQPGDVHRILFGDAPWPFTLEVIFRLSVLYGALVVAMRLMGRRLASQLTRIELIAIISLAGGVGRAVAAPEEGLLPALIVVIWVVIMQRAMAKASFHSHHFEHWVQGEAATLLADGSLDLTALRKNGISRDALFAELRVGGVTQLGVLERVYLEPNGTFSPVRAARERPGLSIVPDWDHDFRDGQRQSGSARACGACGHVAELTLTHGACQRCSAVAWTPAIEPAL